MINKELIIEPIKQKELQLQVQLENKKERNSNNTKDHKNDFDSLFQGELDKYKE